jgi:succinate-acetate transporter protein
VSIDGHREVTGPQWRINLRPLANPLPLGLFSFGIGMVLLGAQSAGWTPAAQDTQVGLVMVAFVFPLEGLTLGVALILGPPATASLALGFYLLAFAAVVLTLAAVAAMGKPLIALLLSLSAARAILDGIYQVSGDTGLEHAAGYVAVGIAAVAWYAGTAFLVEDLRQASVLPVFRRGPSTAAVDGRLGDQLGHAAGEAGVRQQL